MQRVRFSPGDYVDVSISSAIELAAGSDLPNSYWQSMTRNTECAEDLRCLLQ